jgi:hypothetical protein
MLIVLFTTMAVPIYHIKNVSYIFAKTNTSGDNLYQAAITNNDNNNKLGKNNDTKFTNRVSKTVFINSSPTYSNSYNDTHNYTVPFIGVDMEGYYTSMAQTRNFSSLSYLPSNYYDDLFKLLSQSGMNHVRYVVYWESYVRNPGQFINELNEVADTADRYGIKVIYANHQFHTSSWFDENSGIGFPSFLFKSDPSLYKFDSGGTPKSKISAKWWRNWLDRKITDNKGNDGWALQADFLTKIVYTADKHPSTLGYEILGESQVHKVDEWDKLRQYNIFMTDVLRKITPKVMVFSMSTPVDIEDPKIGVTPENIAKTIPVNTTNSSRNIKINHNFIFKFDMYDLPTPNSLEGKRLEVFANAGQIAKVPIYAGEWNIVARVKNANHHFSLDPDHSTFNQTEADYVVHKLQDMGVWGMAYWRLKFEPYKIPTYNLINVTPTTNRHYLNNSTSIDTGTPNTAIIHPTKYFDILKNTVPKVRINLGS